MVHASGMREEGIRANEIAAMRAIVSNDGTRISF
jgi:hypothetical protein